MEEDNVVRALCYLYWSAYHAGHNDTVESQYTDVLPVDRFDYHSEAVMECMQCGDMASLGVAIEQARREWKDAVDNELVVMESTADSYPTPRDAIRALIDWHVCVALDPLVSSDAETLIERGRRESAQRIAELAAERDALKADAERYRWLVEDHDDADMRTRVRLVAGSIAISGKGYTDAAIDAAKGE